MGRLDLRQTLQVAEDQRLTIRLRQAGDLRIEELPQLAPGAIVGRYLALGSMRLLATTAALFGKLGAVGQSRSHRVQPGRQ
jgi:hypothetical protein